MAIQYTQPSTIEEVIEQFNNPQWNTGKNIESTIKESFIRGRLDEVELVYTITLKKQTTNIYIHAECDL